MPATTERTIKTEGRPPEEAVIAIGEMFQLFPSGRTRRRLVGQNELVEYLSTASLRMDDVKTPVPLVFSIALETSEQTILSEDQAQALRIDVVVHTAENALLEQRGLLTARRKLLKRGVEDGFRGLTLLIYPTDDLLSYTNLPLIEKGSVTYERELSAADIGAYIPKDPDAKRGINFVSYSPQSKKLVAGMRGKFLPKMESRT